EKWDGQTYYIKVEIVADPDSIAESIKELVAKKESLGELRESKAQADAALEEVARLRAELEAAKAALVVAKTEGKDSPEDVSKVMELQKQYIGETEKMTAYSLWEQGYALFNKHKYEEALGYFDRAIEMNPNMARAYGMRGAVYLKTGLYKKALADLNIAIEFKPSAGNLYFRRWYAHSKLKMKNKARADLKKSAELGFWKAKLKLSKKRGSII
ncbi:MAG: tetratricopeptide repeat protein, partial [Thermodesulfovibrionales bacterium]|nr:tetratricopeptide repeat protein [Thermodesulfovibrionales bacterium]